MGKPTGFMEFGRELPLKRDPKLRIQDYKELELPTKDTKIITQAARCMDCGIPFCHDGCPLGNIIPEFNDAVYEKNWEEAYHILSSTNNFPEFTGRICPAPCEASCVLGINKPPVAIEFIEKSIIEIAYKKGLVIPHTPSKRTGKKIAVVGSGPAGLAVAGQLNKTGHLVTVFERDDAIGGLLKYGIPDFKLEKWVVERRIKIMEEEGILFKINTHVGIDIKAKDLLEEFDAVVLCGGSTVPRDLQIPGRELKGIHFAMQFLKQQNIRVNGGNVAKEKEIWATNKNVIVIGGGDTGSDCVGTSNRHGAKSVSQIELFPIPPKARTLNMPWPGWPHIFRTSSSHEEGCDRKWALTTKEFLGDKNGNLIALKVAQMEWNETKQYVEVPGTEQEIPCELALLAMGFIHPQHEGMLAELGVECDERGNVKTTHYQSSVPKVFSAGDMRRGQSLVVWAISEGREAARHIDKYLMGESELEAKEVSRVNVSELLLNHILR